jgi:hypothetical protein
MTFEPVDHEPTRYWVTSESRPGEVHLVDSDCNGQWMCSCEDCMARDRECKHIRFLKQELAR